MEYLPWLAALRPLDVLTVITALGLVIEAMRSERRQGEVSPQLWWVVAFAVWTYPLLILDLGSRKGCTVVWEQSHGPLFMLLVAFAARGLPRVRAMAWALIACAVIIG